MRLVDVYNEFRMNVHRHNRIGAVCVLNYRIAHFFYSKHKLLGGGPVIYFYHIFFRHLIGLDLICMKEQPLRGIFVFSIVLVLLSTPK